MEKYSALQVSAQLSRHWRPLDNGKASTQTRVVDCVTRSVFRFHGGRARLLGRHTRFIRVPAVRDATDDATEKRGSCVTEIMDLVVRSVLASRKDVTTFKEDTQAKYKEILDPSKLTELTTLQSQLTSTLKHYAPDASVFPSVG